VSNPCSSPDPHCLNGGTCFFSAGTGAATCTCAAGFDGDRCQRRACAVNEDCGASASCKGGLCVCNGGLVGKSLALASYVYTPNLNEMSDDALKFITPRRRSLALRAISSLPAKSSWPPPPSSSCWPAAA